jgi:predicted acylesterase/phospholipase RssA
MPIKHLIIAGGGPIGLQFFGVLEHLNKEGFWKLEDIETIYATSIGTMISVFISLNYDWETLKTYIVGRPWNDVFKLNGKQIFDAFYNKGLFSKKVFESTFKPLLEAKDLSLNVTLKEFYEYTKIEFHLYTFEQNTFKTVDLSYKTHPDLSLIQAVMMSCAIPGLFMPTCIDDCCYIDGGVMANYPLGYCLNDNGGIEKQDEMLGITFYRDYSKPDAYKNNTITEDSSVLEFAIGFFINAMNYIYKNIKKDKIVNQIECKNDERFLTVDVMREAINNQEMRQSWIQRGYDDAKQFLENIEIQKNNICCKTT